MKILHVVPTYIPAKRYGGPIQSVHGLCRALVRRGWEVHVATTNVDGPGESAVPLDEPVALDGVQVHYFPSHLGRRLFYSPAMGRFLRATMGGYAMVHLHSVFLWPTLAAARAARDAAVPYVLSPRGMLVGELIRRRNALIKRSWITLFESRNVGAAAAVHCTSELERHELLALRLAPRETFVVPNGVELPRAAAAARGDSVVFLGRINWKKGLDRLIEAMRDVPGARLVVAGNDDEGLTSGLQAQARTAGVGDRVQFTGYVEGEAKARLLAGAGVLVMPSVSENFGNAVLEAMAHGCPVVVTKDVGLAEAVQASGAGVVADPDPPSLARAIRSLLDEPARRIAAGAAARAVAHERYSWERVAAEMGKHYERLRHA